MSSMLNARDSSEENNRLKNCLELERFRLQIVEPQLMAEKIDNVVTALSKTNAALSETNAKLFQLVDLLMQKEQHSHAKKRLV